MVFNGNEIEKENTENIDQKSENNTNDGETIEQRLAW